MAMATVQDGVHLMASAMRSHKTAESFSHSWLVDGSSTTSDITLNAPAFITNPQSPSPHTVSYYEIKIVIVGCRTVGHGVVK